MTSPASSFNKCNTPENPNSFVDRGTSTPSNYHMSISLGLAIFLMLSNSMLNQLLAG